MLKDRNDEIHLDIPVYGNLNDPDFSLAGTIFTVIRNLLVKAATSPFALLTSVLGSDQDFSSISFPPGIARIDTEQRDKLAELAGVLAERSALTLEISAFADREQGPEAYRQDQLQQMLLAVKQRELAESGETAAEQPLQINPEEYPELLITVYKEAEFPRPKNFVGMLENIARPGNGKTAAGPISRPGKNSWPNWPKCAPWRSGTPWSNSTRSLNPGYS